MIENELKYVTLDGLAFLLEMDRKKVVKLLQDADIVEFELPAVVEEEQLLTYDEAFTLWIKTWLGEVLKGKSTELNRIIRDFDLTFRNRTEIVKIRDTDIVTVKVRLKTARGLFLDWIEKAPRAEPAKPEEETGDPDEEETGDPESDPEGGDETTAGDEAGADA